MKLIFGIFIFAQCLAASPSFYPSGLLRENSIELGSSASLGSGGAQEFLKNQFDFLDEQYFAWKKVHEFQDGYHRSVTYVLTAEGRPVVGQYVRLHFDKFGQLVLASSSIQQAPKGFYPIPSSKDSIEVQAKRLLVGQPENFVGWLDVQKTYWFNEDDYLKPAFEIRASYRVFRNEEPKTKIRHFIVEEGTGRVLKEFLPFRKATAAATAYRSSPFGGATPAAVTLTELSNLTSLLNAEVHVRREQTPTTLVEVTPQDYSGSISTNPNSYNYTCTGSTTACENQAFDAVNVYYHLTQYRSFLGTYFTNLGVSPTFSYDPLKVIINTLSIDFDGDGTGTNEKNNAAYVPQVCRSDNSIDHCLVFLRPAPVGPNTICSASTVDFYDLAREAIVIAHEYQHYVTDMITGFVGGTSDAPNVADALHEGISDYLAASYVTNLNGSDVTLVGKYAFQNCSAIQRELSTIYPFTASASGEVEDPHLSGLSWASALWKLRTELGREVVDSTLLKALTLLPVSPSYNEAVEALVRANDTLYSGANIGRIRTVMYVDAGLTGGQNFQDAARGVADLGVRSCVGVHGDSSAPLPIALLFVTWMISLRWCGRQVWRK